MNRHMKFTAAFVICTSASLLAIGGGCAKSNDEKFPEKRTRHDAEESSFAAGSGRAPTAATSYSFAKILVNQGRDRDALYVLSRIVREHPKFLPAYNEMASVYMRADRLDDAIATLTTGLEQSPKDAVLHNNLGMCYLLKEEPEKALDSFTHATDAVPNSSTFRSNRAAALVLTARDAEAESEYRTVVGSLQAKQNVLALAKARDIRSESNEKHGIIERPAAVTKPAPFIATPTPAPAAVESPAPARTPELKASAPAPSQEIKITAPPAAIKASQSTSSIDTPDRTPAITAPAIAPARDTAIHTLAGAASLGTTHSPTSAGEVTDPTPWIAPVPTDLLEKREEPAESPEPI